MPGAARLGDLCTGHGCYGGRPNAQGSDNTYIDGKKAHCYTHTWSSHCCGPPCHGGNLADGSRDTLVNNLYLGHCGSPVSCGGVVAKCSKSVIVNGG